MSFSWSLGSPATENRNEKLPETNTTRQLDVHFGSPLAVVVKIGWLGSSLSEPPADCVLGARFGSTPATHVRLTYQGLTK